MQHSALFVQRLPVLGGGCKHDFGTLHAAAHLPLVHAGQLASQSAAFLQIAPHLATHLPPVHVVQLPHLQSPLLRHELPQDHSWHSPAMHTPQPGARQYSSEAHAPPHAAAHWPPQHCVQLPVCRQSVLDLQAWKQPWPGAHWPPKPPGPSHREQLADWQSLLP